MPRFRSKRVEIDAIQFLPDNWGEVREFLSNHGYEPPYAPKYPRPATLHLRTANGQIVGFNDGDWIVAEDEPGRFYPVLPNVFEKRWEPYEPIEEFAARRKEQPSDG